MPSNVEALGTKLYNALTANDMAPMVKSERVAIHVGCTMLAIGLDSLCRIADALERSATAAEGVRPAHDSLDAL